MESSWWPATVDKATYAENIRHSLHPAGAARYKVTHMVTASCIVSGVWHRDCDVLILSIGSASIAEENDLAELSVQ